MDSMSNVGIELNNFFDNNVVKLVLALLVSLYAGLAAPKLPNEVIMFFAIQ